MTFIRTNSRFSWGNFLYYYHTIQAIRKKIEEKEPGTKPEFSELKPGSVAPLSYILWMCDQIEIMETWLIENSCKSGRWIGWVLAHIEMYSIWDNNESRELVRYDCSLDLDQPH